LFVEIVALAVGLARLQSGVTLRGVAKEGASKKPDALYNGKRHDSTPSVLP
jgi:hypothetical protein